jgi:hypothetical protein
MLSCKHVLDRLIANFSLEKENVLYTECRRRMSSLRVAALEWGGWTRAPEDFLRCRTRVLLNRIPLRGVIRSGFLLKLWALGHKQSPS